MTTTACISCGRRDLTPIAETEGGACDLHGASCARVRCKRCGELQCAAAAQALTAGEEALAMLRAMEGVRPS